MTAPLVWRPLRPRVVAIGFSIVLVVGSLVAWEALGPAVRARFTGLQVGTLVLFILVMVVMMLALGLCFVRAESDGLVLRNGLRTHRVPWSAIEGLSFPDGAAWPTLSVDETWREAGSLMVMGIQRSDGDRAQRQYAELARAIAHRGAPPASSGSGGEPA